ncbi:MAG: hypothetical protein IBX52_10595 [Bacterioplanes sp.]|nr:hypothetical protein [Bacterioplanes sp.]
MKNDQDVRRQQTRVLMQENALDVALMAACLAVDETLLQAMLAERPTRKIPDVLARTMEQTFSKPLGWLDCVDDGGIAYDLLGQ